MVWGGKERTYTTCTVFYYENERVVAREVRGGAFVVKGAQADAVLF